MAGAAGLSGAGVVCQPVSVQPAAAPQWSAAGVYAASWTAASALRCSRQFSCLRAAGFPDRQDGTWATRAAGGDTLLRTAQPCGRDSAAFPSIPVRVTL